MSFLLLSKNCSVTKIKKSVTPLQNEKEVYLLFETLLHSIKVAQFLHNILVLRISYKTKVYGDF
jgi:hypothetical protein